MSKRRSVAKGFTLVEILIVVVILGILAAIVIPQFSSASESAKQSSVLSQLQTIRSQLELYKNQHNGDYPALADMNDATNPWFPLIENTDIDGSLNTTNGKYGPYLQQPSTNPFENSSTLAAAAAAGVGWQYDAASGDIKAVLPAAKAAELWDTVPTSDIATY